MAIISCRPETRHTILIRFHVIALLLRLMAAAIPLRLSHAFIFERRRYVLR